MHKIFDLREMDIEQLQKLAEELGIKATVNIVAAAYSIKINKAAAIKCTCFNSFN